MLSWKYLFIFPKYISHLSVLNSLYLSIISAKNIQKNIAFSLSKNDSNEFFINFAIINKLKDSAGTETVVCFSKCPALRYQKKSGKKRSEHLAFLQSAFLSISHFKNSVGLQLNTEVYHTLPWRPQALLSASLPS